MEEVNEVKQQGLGGDTTTGSIEKERLAVSPHTGQSKMSSDNAWGVVLYPANSKLKAWLYHLKTSKPRTTTYKKMGMGVATISGIKLHAAVTNW